MQALVLLNIVDFLLGSGRLTAFLVTSCAPSNSNTSISSISVLAVSDFIVSSSCGFAFGVTGGVFFAGVESVWVFFELCTSQSLKVATCLP